MRNLRTLGLVLMAMPIALPAWGINYRSPGHFVEEGDQAIGVNYENYNRDFDIEGEVDDADIEVLGATYTLGIAQGAGALTFGAGLLEVGVGDGSDADGIEGHVVYRHNLDAGMAVDASNAFRQFRKGFMLAARTGFAEDNDGNTVDFIQLDGGFGVTTPLTRELWAYGGGVVSIVSGEVYVEAIDTSYDLEQDDLVGAYGGIEFHATEDILIGGELHILHETGIGVYAEFGL